MFESSLALLVYIYIYLFINLVCRMPSGAGYCRLAGRRVSVRRLAGCRRISDASAPPHRVPPDAGVRLAECRRLRHRHLVGC